MASKVLMPRAAAEFIAKNSVHVQIKQQGITSTSKKLFEMFKKDRSCLDVSRWNLHALNPKSRDEHALNWVFISDLLNFSFWSPDNQPKYCVQYAGQRWTGYWSLCAAMNRAHDEGIPVTDPHWYGKVTKYELAKLFRSDNPEASMPLLDERLDGLHSAAKVLIEKYDGRFANLVNACNKSAVSLYKKVVEEFESFRDETTYNGEKVALYKRAQILVADIWACFGGTHFGRFDDIDELTAFADYRIPQALVWFGVLKYSDELMNRLRNEEMLQYGEPMEVEIRGGTLQAILLIVEEVNKLIQADETLKSESVRPLNSVLIDHFMWDYRREHDEEIKTIPFHKTRCIYY